MRVSLGSGDTVVIPLACWCEARDAMLLAELPSRVITVGGSPVRGGEFMAATQAEQWKRL